MPGGGPVASQVMIFGPKPMPLARAASVRYRSVSILVTRSSPGIRDHSAALWPGDRWPRHVPVRFLWPTPP